MIAPALKLVWMSDLHFTADGRVLDHDPRARLDAAEVYVNRHHSDADFCVITGDLVNRGTVHDYAVLRQHLDRLCLPYLILPGNHDSRAEMRQIFEMPQGCMKDFVQYARCCAQGLVVCLDTLNPGSDAGLLCPARLGWLRDLLARASGIPILLFMHHPPMMLGLPMQDADRLENGADLLALLTPHRETAHLFIGHVHRATGGRVAGIPFTTMRSVLYQAPAPRPDWDWHSFTPAAEPPTIGVIHVSDGNITLHHEQICEAQDGR